MEPGFLSGEVSAMRSGGIPWIAGIAVAQAILEFLLSAQWIRAGGATFERGVVVLPLIGTLLIAWGGFAALIGLLYLLFAWAALTGRAWAWATGLLAVVLNAFAIVVLVLNGETPARIALRAVAPVIVLCFLLTPAAKRALRSSHGLGPKAS
jgi:hypothetical protein